MLYEEKRKQIINISRILIAISFLFIVLIPGVSAADSDSFPQAMLDRVNTGFTSDIITLFSEDDPFFKLMTSSEEQPEIVSSVFDGLIVVGVLGAMIIAFIRFFESIQRGQDGVECAFKFITEFFFVALILINLEKIMGGAVQLGVSLIDIVSGRDLTDANTDLLTMEQVCGKANPTGISWFTAVIILIIPWIISWVMVVFVKFTAYSFLLEIGIRRAFAPIACCDIYAEGLRSPGFRYLKRFLAVFVKIMICIFVAFLAQTISNSALSEAPTLTEVFNFIFAQIAINFTAIGVMGKASEYANDIVGV